jgi:hypothetical protein
VQAATYALVTLRAHGSVRVCEIWWSREGGSVRGGDGIVESEYAAVVVSSA